MADLTPDELVLNPDGSIYHLSLFPEEVAPNIILVGDPERVEQVSQFFDRITTQKSNREFHTHTGEFEGMPLTVISTGIGADNIDIVVNEVDALVNIDLATKTIKQHKTALRITRIGTCGALQPDIQPGTPIIGDYGLGLDNLATFYNLAKYTEEEHLTQKLQATFTEKDFPYSFYLFMGSASLREQFRHLGSGGITATCPGFYGPQGRTMRLSLNHANFLEALSSFNYKNLRILNFEMETSALYALSRGLDHDCCAVNLALANRATGEFLSDYKETMNEMIASVLKAWPKINNESLGT